MDQRIIPLGHVSGVHGVQGWVKIHSLTEPREAIFDYQPWLLGDSREEVRVSQGKKHGNRLIALFEDIDDREAAERLVNRPIAVYREQLPESEDGEFYWTDLEGLAVELADGTPLGTIDRMMATGANDVMVVKGERERLIPFVLEQYVQRVDLEHGVVVVDWDPEF
ncbi:MAG: ribosome maturation factor RimM [Xanthomonadales bacterium]|nr:ribosome maturation factor RimM [Xanthomonadales bacterium]